VGAALSEKHFPGFTYDDTGDNISQRNRSYCELTAQYWAWKNVEADYYGFFHYRRYLYPGPAAKRPYYIKRALCLPLLERLGYTQFEAFIEQYDLILPKGENMYIPVEDHYASSLFHHEKDLQLVKEIVQELFPAYKIAMDTYLSGTVCYFGNIFIMKKQAFYNYCSWLFPILEEFNCRVNTTSYIDQERRVNGYLAERLLGVYYVYQQTYGKLRLAELPGIHFYTGMEYVQRRLLNAVLPPGTRRRMIVKHWMRALSPGA